MGMPRKGEGIMKPALLENGPLAGPIAWRRVAEPQTDRYDTAVVLELLGRQSFVRRGVGKDSTCFDDRVALRYEPGFSFPPWVVPAPPDHPHIEQSCSLLRLWPAVFLQFQDLVESITPLQNISNNDHHYSAGLLQGFGRVAATVNHPVELAECLVHETAHCKLQALGVSFETAARIIRNRPGQVYPSPIRVDRLRPMPAVLQAQYALTYMVGLHIHIIEGASIPSGYRKRAGSLLSSDLSRLEFGLRVITDHAEFDSAGADFWEGYVPWCQSLLNEGRDALARAGIALRPFAHPLLSQSPPESSGMGRHPDKVVGQGFPVPDDLAGLRPCRRKGVEQHPVVDDLVLYEQESNRTFALNRSAAAIWELCDGTRTANEIACELERALGTDERTLRDDVRSGILELYRLGLLESSARPDARVSVEEGATVA
jgi:hypothetical protein